MYLEETFCIILRCVKKDFSIVLRREVGIPSRVHEQYSELSKSSFLPDGTIQVLGYYFQPRAFRQNGFVRADTNSSAETAILPHDVTIVHQQRSTASDWDARCACVRV